jgi:outer membrane protein assembly complex protein YaeT
MACLLIFASLFAVPGSSQTLDRGFGLPHGLGAPSPDSPRANSTNASDSGSASAAQPIDPLTSPQTPDTLSQWEGLPVRHIVFANGVAPDRLAPILKHLPVREGQPLTRENVQRALRQIYSSGLYATIEVQGTRHEDGVALLFTGTPNSFVGTVSVEGAKGATLDAQLQRATRLTAGARFTQAQLQQAIEQMRRTMADNGFPLATVSSTLTPHPNQQLIDIALRVSSGPQARVGSVQISGDSDLSTQQFRSLAHLRGDAHIDHETANHALSEITKHFQKQDRLEAEIKLDPQHYDPASGHTNFAFKVRQGPVVHITVEGVRMNPARARHIIPIFEEGTVDEDLLNEGDRRLRDYFQRLGYFNVKVEHQQSAPTAETLTILYRVHLGARRRVASVRVAGNHYFDAPTLQETLSVHAAGGMDHHGAYNQTLVAADIRALQALYQNNGFSKVKVVSEVQPAQAAHRAIPDDAAPLAVVYRINEGVQQRVASVQLDGVEHGDRALLLSQLNTTPGQLLSPQNLAGDRDLLLTDYLNRGFENVRVEINEKPDAADENNLHVTFHISEGAQIFVREVLLRGLENTRPSTVAKAITLHPGDPLDQTSLAEIQRSLYDFALFSEVDTAVENAAGTETNKTVLIQASEARRWVLTYGGGFEAQLGTPQNNCQGAAARNLHCSEKTTEPINPRVLVDITRNNLFGREQSASLRGNYGFLEQKVDLLYQIPHFEGNHNIGLTFSGGYANSADVSTYVASAWNGGMRWTERFDTPASVHTKPNTFIYEFNFRLVKVDGNNLEVAQAETIPLSTAQRVIGPGFTWIRDTRDSPLDAHRGTYTSFQEFVSAAALGAEVGFNRIDLSNSSYYSFDKGHFILARNTRYGQERAFGSASERLIPLPERLYAGGATSLRGFSLNAAGPRDPETGYPIGGAGALINSTELRLPTLPGVANSVSLVLFHDIGNVVTNAGDLWSSASRFNQPYRDTCKNPQALPSTTQWSSTGLKSACNFNYFSQAPGIGLRYHTPVGPVRLDFSYNLNTPIYPVLLNYTNLALPSTVGEANHFNVFFSLGQTF